MLSILARIHDRLTLLTFWCAVVAVFYLTATTSFEVFARYLFRLPTSWAPDTSSVAFAYIAFLAAPELTRVSGHASMTFVVESAAPAISLFMRRFALLFAAGACLVLVWYGAIETWRQYAQGVTMIAVTPLAKWIVTGAIVYGMASSALYFLRQFGATFVTGRQG